MKKVSKKEKIRTYESRKKHPDEKQDKILIKKMIKKSALK